MRQTIALCLTGFALLAGCSGEPSEQRVSHGEFINWLRSDYNIVGREVKEFPDHSGEYAVFIINHGNKRITAECSATWTSETGEDLPSTLTGDLKCSPLPMGPVKLERSDWDTLHYFTGSGKHREQITLSVKKIEIR